MRRKVWQRAAGSAVFVLLLLCAGCRSAWVRATVINQQPTAVKLVEVDYPGGGFGVQSIAAHASYHYRFHILDSGTVSVSFTDSEKHSHAVKGPEMRPGQQGTLQITIQPDGGVVWQPALTNPR